MHANIDRPLSLAQRVRRGSALALLLCACTREHSADSEHAPTAKINVQHGADASAPPPDADCGAGESGVGQGSADAGSTASRAPSDAGAHDVEPEQAQRVDRSRGPLRLTHSLSWPGGGVQLIVTAPPTKQPVERWPEPRVTREDGSELPWQRAALSEPHGITALLISPAADPHEHALQLEAAAALVEALPEGERIGVWLGSAQLPLACELTEHRAHVLERLAAIAPQQADHSPVDPDALYALQRRLKKIGGPYAPAGRALIGVGLPELAATDSDKVVPLVRLGRVSDTNSDAFGWDKHTSATAAGQALGAALLRAREQSYRLGACGVVTHERLMLSLGEQQIETIVPAELTGLPAACDAAAAAADSYPFPADVALVMDEAQLAEHDRLAAAKDESDFPLQFAFGAGEPIPARAHFRGQTSLECARKNYSIHFADNEARRLMSRAYANEFILLSMCWDTGWYRQVLANRMMAKLGLFPLEQRYVRLRAGGRELGVYLMLEKPDESLRSQQSELAGLIRRRYDPANEAPKSQWPKATREPVRAAHAIEQYLALVALLDTSPPEALADALSQRLDLDEYLRWLAVMNYFQSGDYADEVFFYASDEAAAGGWYFRTHGWDSDDLFRSCHHDGKYMIKDPHGLLYCLEGNLDRALFIAPDIYRRFALQLRALIQGPLAQSAVYQELDDIHAELQRLLTEDAVCAGTGLMLDEQPATCATLHPWLDTAITNFKGSVRGRSNGLLDRIDKYLEAP